MSFFQMTIQYDNPAPLSLLSNDFDFDLPGDCGDLGGSSARFRGSCCDFAVLGGRLERTCGGVVLTQELFSEWSMEGMMNSGSAVLDLELCRVTLLVPGVSVRDDVTGSTEFLFDCIRDDLLRLGWFSPSALSTLLRATSGDGEVDEASEISSNSSVGSKSSSESTVAHDAVSWGFDRFVTRGMICDGLFWLFLVSKRFYICSGESGSSVCPLAISEACGTLPQPGGKG
jgi:hypothetical protein